MGILEKVPPEINSISFPKLSDQMNPFFILRYSNIITQYTLNHILKSSSAVKNIFVNAEKRVALIHMLESSDVSSYFVKFENPSSFFSYIEKMDNILSIRPDDSLKNGIDEYDLCHLMMRYSSFKQYLKYIKALCEVQKEKVVKLPKLSISKRSAFSRKTLFSLRKNRNIVKDACKSIPKQGLNTHSALNYVLKFDEDLLKSPRLDSLISIGKKLRSDSSNNDDCLIKNDLEMNTLAEFTVRNRRIIHYNALQFFLAPI